MAVLPLRCGVQCYAWGKLGFDSEVARQAVAGHHLPAEAIRSDRPYAELWIGSYPACPAHVVDCNRNNKLLSDWLKLHKQADVGVHDLTFLCKVLSIGKALSVQVHPTKAQAALLHQQDPQTYRDANHKPELAIAVTDFELLAGFRPLAEILQFCKEIPIFATAIGEDVIVKLEQGDAVDEEEQVVLRQIFGRILTMSNDFAAATVRRLVAKLSCSADNKTTDAERLFLKLNSVYPDDPGCLMAFVMNHLKLKPGQAAYVEPNTPHAFLYGDCVCVVANSDNVIRGALTAKPKDVDALLKHTIYKAQPSQQLCLVPKKITTTNEIVEILEYAAPKVEDIKALRFEAKSTSSSTIFTIGPFNSDCFVAIIRGRAVVTTISQTDDNNKTEVHDGSVLFVSKSVIVRFQLGPAGGHVLGFVALEGDKGQP